jgi:mono/diheme cytochrome c family protein
VWSSLPGLRGPIGLLLVLAVVACGAPAPAPFAAALTPAAGADGPLGPGAADADAALLERVLRGRHLVISRGCGDCHGGWPNPAADGWLAGQSGDDRAYVMPPYRVWARNLTPDRETGLGGYTDRQIFNALRYGLRPAMTPDVDITSATPGEGNHPARPNYLAPAMPWASYRHMTDSEILDIIAYLRHLDPVSHALPDGDRPADFWAGEYTAEAMGPLPLSPFPTANEELRDPSRRDQVLYGRALVVSLACGDCHGGRGNPAAAGWLAGVLPAEQAVHAGPFEQAFAIGPFATYPRNLTPDNVTGLGRFSERQIFNALRYGLRPGETADVEITSPVPGVGNHPLNPKYLAPPMPWPAWRHLTDAELWAVAAYLKEGVKPVRNLVPDSEGPPDFWAGDYLSGMFGPYPAAAFPTARERRPGGVAEGHLVDPREPGNDY